MSYLTYTFLIVAVFCAIVVIHEFGHFIVAKVLGIPAEVFSVGFGPKLWGTNIGGTDFRISAIPLGGYVRFRGENLEAIQGKSEGTVDEFLAHPKWKRFLVALAGPAFNIATAILIPTVGILIGFQDSIFSDAEIVVGRVQPGSAADLAGLQKGDRIIAYGDNKKPSWEDFSLDVRIRPDKEMTLTVDRNGQISNPVVKLQSQLVDKEKMGTIGIEPYLAGVGVARVSPDTPAALAGLQAGDKITAINGVEITSYSHFKEMLQESKGQNISVSIIRKGQNLDLQVTPMKDGNEYRLGFVAALVRFVKTDSVLTALRYGFDYNWRILRVTAEAIRQVFNRERSARTTVGGPVRIAEQVTEAYDVGGWAAVVGLTGMLSLSLGVMNLLPIPVLDGGMIMMILVEAIFGLLGWTLTMNVREKVQYVGLAMVLLLMGFVFYNDIAYSIEKKFGKPPAEQQAQPAK